MSIDKEFEKTRTRETDQAMESVASLMSGMKAIRALGAQPGRFTDLLGSLYVPNVKSGRRDKQEIIRLETPREYRNDTSIPVFMMNRNEQVYANPAMMTMHADQRDMLVSYSERNPPAEGHEDIESEVTRLLDGEIRRGGPVSLSDEDIEEQGRQKTTTKDIKMKVKGLDYIFSGRPSIYLPRTKMLPQRSVGLMLFHQLVHADHILQRGPILEAKLRYDDIDAELNARRLESRLALASLPYSMAKPDQRIV